MDGGEIFPRRVNRHDATWGAIIVTWARLAVPHGTGFAS